MFCLVYQSVASWELDLREMKALLRNARRFNRGQEITGCLLYKYGAFLQYLEGNQIRVLSLYDSIKKDKRHRDVSLIAHGNVPRREFSNWDMAYANDFGKNELINYLNLVSENLPGKSLRSINPNPTSIEFWVQVNRLFHDAN